MRGDHYVVNGQKTWTSGGQWADKCFCLVRTDKSDKHKGISFLLIDMTAPGVEVKPIKMISGMSPFCETFFTDVKVPKENLVGEEGQGWTIGKRLLQHERTNLSGGGSRLQMSGPSLADLAKKFVGAEEDGKIADRDLRARIAKWEMDWRAFQLTAMRVMAESKAVGGVSEVSSILKTVGTKLGQERSELIIEIEGLQGLGWEGEGFTPERTPPGPRLALRQGDDDLWRIDRGPEQHHRQAHPRDARPPIIAAAPTTYGKKSTWPYSAKNRRCCAIWRASGPATKARSMRGARCAMPTMRHGYDAAAYGEMAQMGWSGIIVPEAYGGSDFGWLSLGLVIEELGKTVTASPLAASAAAASAIILGGSDEQKQKWLPGIAGGEIVATLAIDEGPRHDPQNIKTSVSGGKLSGTKAFVAEGDSAGLFVVAAADGLYLVAGDSAGVSRSRRKLTDFRSHAEITFDGAEADKLAGGGDDLLDQVLDRARVLAAAEMLGMAGQGFETTLAYLKQRVQFGQVLATFQALQHRMANLFSEIELMRSAVEAGLAAIDRGGDTRQAALLAKVKANEVGPFDEPRDDPAPRRDRHDRRI